MNHGRFRLSPLAMALALLATPVFAQTPAAESPTKFSIASKPLGEALNDWALQSAIQLIVRPDLVAGKIAPAVNGTLSAREGLVRLLSGSGLAATLDGSAAIIREATPTTSSSPLPTVTIVGQRYGSSSLPAPYAGGQVARGGTVGVLGNRDYMDTPFSQASYTAKLIQDQQARGIIDVVANDASVRASYSANAYDDRVFIRGFSQDVSAFQWNGLAGIAPSIQDLSGYERVEILKGSTAFLNGMALGANVGGTINLVPKRAQDKPTGEVTLSYEQDSVGGLAVDLGRRYGEDKEFGVRLNTTYRSGDTAVDHTSIDVRSLSLALDYRRKDTRISLDGYYGRQHLDAPQTGGYLGAGVALPDSPSGTTNFYLPWGFTNTEESGGALRIEHDLRPDLTILAAVGGRRSNGRYLIEYPTILSDSGDLVADPFLFSDYYKSVSAELGVKGRLKTGSVNHELMLIGSHVTQETGFAYTPFSSITSNIFDPSDLAAPDLSLASGAKPKSSEQKLSGVAIGDVLSMLDGGLDLMVGGRYQTVSVSNFAPTGETTDSYDKSRWTTALGIVAKPLDDVSVYANYIEALEVGPTAPMNVANAGKVFPPLVSRQYELGVKVDFGGLGGSFDVFQITRANGFTDSETNTFVVDGRQRTRGAEISMFGEVTPRVRALGGVTYLKAIQTATADGINDGQRAVGVARVQANLGTEWDTPFLQNLTLTTRGIYTGSAPIDDVGTQVVPSWFRLDLGARYAINPSGSRPISIRLSIQNVLGKDYWMAAPGFLTLGTPRTVQLSTTVAF